MVAYSIFLQLGAFLVRLYGAGGLVVQLEPELLRHVDCAGHIRRESVQSKVVEDSGDSDGAERVYTECQQSTVDALRNSLRETLPVAAAIAGFPRPQRVACHVQVLRRSGVHRKLEDVRERQRTYALAA